MTAKPTGSSFSSCSLPADTSRQRQKCRQSLRLFPPKHCSFADIHAQRRDAILFVDFLSAKVIPNCGPTFALKPISVSTANETFPLDNLRMAYIVDGNL